MTERIEKSLYDILHAIQETESFLHDEIPTLEVFRSNVLAIRASERNLEIIGEAVNRILKEDPGFPITDAYRIIGLRNQIIHGYDSISVENIYSVIVNHLPLLRTEVQQLLK